MPDTPQSLNIFSFSLSLSPKAKRILRLVSILQGSPFSILAMVTGETLAFRDNSALLINSDSRISFSELLTMSASLKLNPQTPMAPPMRTSCGWRGRFRRHVRLLLSMREGAGSGQEVEIIYGLFAYYRQVKQIDYNYI
jgi:hypothetical protein